jgi:rubredoxin
MESKKYKCAKCGFTYDPEAGDPKHGIAPGTPFEELPEDWKCPRCRKPKDQFVEKVEKKEATLMEEKKVILEAMKKAGEPLNAGKIAELTGLDRKLVDKAMEAMKKDGSIVSPVRCKWEPAEK